MLNNNEFGAKIADLRKEKGLTQAQLADLLNISNKTVSRWETGEGYPEITLLSPLARALGVTVDELLAEPAKENGDDDESQSDSDNSHISQNNGSKPKKHKEIPVEWQSASDKRLTTFWKSLTVFNKVGLVCAVICVIFPLIGFIILALTHNSIIEITDYVCVDILSVALTFTLASKIGLITVIIGFLLGAMDLYDRQYKASIILAVINLVLPYVMGTIFTFLNLIII